MKQEFAPIHQLLTSYRLSTPKEEFDKEKMLEFIIHVPNCFERSCRLGHFTASAFLLNVDMTSTCLLHHAKLNLWVQPGGHADGDPDLRAVALKEAQEETGIQEIRLLEEGIFDIDIHLIPDSSKEAAHYHFDVRFLLHAYGDDTLIQNHESNGLRWVAHDEYPWQGLLAEPSVMRMFEKWKKLNSLGVQKNLSA